MALLMGVVGGVVAGVPLRFLVEAFGWRPVMGVSAALTAMLCVVTWLRVRDDPVERGYASHFQGEHGSHAGTLGAARPDGGAVLSQRLDPDRWCRSAFPARC